QAVLSVDEIDGGDFEVDELSKNGEVVFLCPLFRGQQCRSSAIGHRCRVACCHSCFVTEVFSKCDSQLAKGLEVGTWRMLLSRSSPRNGVIKSLKNPSS